MFRKISIVAMLLPALACTQVLAQDFDFNAESRRLALQSFGYASTLSNAEATIQDMKAENSLAPLEAGFGYLWGEGETGDKWNISVSQSFDWPGAYSARSKSIKAAGRALNAASRSALLSSMLEIKQAMIDVVAARRNMELSKTLNDTIVRLHEVACLGVEKGEVTRLDLNKIEIERIGAARQLAADRRSYSAAVSNLESLCRGDIAPIVENLTDWPADNLLAEEHYTRLLSEENPALAEARENVLAAKAAAVAEQRASLPGFSVGYTYENEGVERWHGVTAGINIPLFTSRGKTKAAKLRAIAAENDALLAMNREIANLKSERAQAVSLHDELSQYKNVLDGTDNIKLLQKALAGGQMSLLDYLGELSYFIGARRNLIDLQYQYSLIVARINRLAMIED